MLNVVLIYCTKLDLFTKLDICRKVQKTVSLSTMPSGNITFPARKETMRRAVEEWSKFLKSVQGQGPPPSLTFTHHPTNKDLWIAGAYGDDPGVVQQILEKIKDYVESRGYKAGMLY